MKTIRHLGWLALWLPAAAWAGTVQITVLARDGQPLTDAVVTVEPSGPRAASPAPATVTIRQEGLAFVPALTVVPVGSRVTFTNLDRFEHHVRGTTGSPLQSSQRSEGFELRMGGRVEGQAPPSASVVLSEAGPVRLGCHLHGSMRGAVYVTDSPWVARTDAQGRITLENVPDGVATVQVWHPDQLIDTPARQITVVSVTPVQFDTPIQPRRRR